MRHRKTDAHIATIRVSVPISAMDAASVALAAGAVNGIAAHLPPGSTVEVLNSRFGRVDAPVVAALTEPQELTVRLPDGSAVPFSSLGKTDKEALPPIKAPMQSIADAMAAVRDQVTAGAMPEPEMPEFLRAPRRA